jgi:hypothetical protein
MRRGKGGWLLPGGEGAGLARFAVKCRIGRGLLVGTGLFGKIPRLRDTRAAGDTRAQWDWRGGGPEGAASHAVGGTEPPQSPVSGAAGNAPP